MGLRSQRALIKHLISQRERCFSPLDVEMIYQFLTQEVSTCPVDYATSVPTEKVHYSTNLESVLGESLQHDGIKRNVFFTNRTGSTMNVKMEVTDTERAILPLHKGLRQRLDDRVRSRWKGSNCE